MAKNFDENARVKIPAILHLTRLNYKYISFKSVVDQIDRDTNIYKSSFIVALNKINVANLSDADVDFIIRDIKNLLTAEDLGKKFYEKLQSGISFNDDNIHLIDFENPENNIYEKVEEFVKISSGSLKLNDFKDTIRRNEDSGYNTDKYYKYSSVTNNYIRYTYDEVKDISSIPLNIYVKYEYYLKTSENDKFEGPRYKKSIGFVDSSITNIDNALNNSKKYYQYISDEDEYVEVKGFLTDGSNNYYGYKLQKYSEYDRNNNSISVAIGNAGEATPQIFIKQHYKAVSISSADDINQYKIKNITLYRLESYDDLISFIPIDNNLTVYDIDKTGNTIYATANDISKTISLNSILTAIDYSTPPSKDEILKDPNSSFLLKNFKVGGNEIKYKASLEGNFYEVNYDDLIDASGNISERYLFIYEDSYNRLTDKLINKIYDSSAFTD